MRSTLSENCFDYFPCKELFSYPCSNQFVKRHANSPVVKLNKPIYSWMRGFMGSYDPTKLFIHHCTLADGWLELNVLVYLFVYGLFLNQDNFSVCFSDFQNVYSFREDSNIIIFQSIWWIIICITKKCCHYITQSISLLFFTCMHLADDFIYT